MSTPSTDLIPPALAQEVTVGAIAGEVEASAQIVSNHLQRMAGQRIVATRRDGNSVYYRLIDPCVGGLIELGLCLLGHDPDCEISPDLLPC